MHPARPRTAAPTAARLAGAGALVAAALAALPIAAADRGRPIAVAQATPRAQMRLRDGGVISGRVLRVDYQRGVVQVSTAGRTLAVIVLPSTNIEGGGSGYRTLADLARGVRVQIFTSLASGRYIAQIIRVR